MKMIYVSLLAILLFAAGAAAQETRGAYTSYIGGNLAARESYTISAPDGESQRAEGEITIGGTKQKVTTIYSKGRPSRFQVEAAGMVGLTAEFGEAGARLQIAGQPEKQVASRASVILENLVWHQYDFLLRQYDEGRGGAQNFTAFLPTQGVDFEVSLQRIGPERFTIDGRELATTRYRLIASGQLQLDFWTDESRTPLLFSIPAQNVKAVREGFEKLLEVAFKTAPPAGARAEEITFQNGDLKLAGTLTLPQSGGPRFPAALLISGSGAQDRDGAAVANLYRIIAERLTAAGFAVLRHDDRGTGKSAMPTKPTSYFDLVGDSRAALAYLRGRPDIDPARIILVGHSEGGLTAKMIASEDERLAGVALLAGATVVNIEGLLIEQTLFQTAMTKPINPGAQDQFPPIVRRIQEQIAGARAGKQDERVTDLNEYFRQHLAIDVKGLLAKVRCPVLILQGERDALVLASQAIAAARTLAEAGNTRVTLRIFPNLSHVFTPAPQDPSIPPGKRLEIDETFLKTLNDWAVETTRR